VCACNTSFSSMVSKSTVRGKYHRQASIYRQLIVYVFVTMFVKEILNIWWRQVAFWKGQEEHTESEWLPGCCLLAPSSWIPHPIKTKSTHLHLQFSLPILLPPITACSDNTAYQISCSSYTSGFSTFEALPMPLSFPCCSSSPAAFSTSSHKVSDT